MDNYIIFDLETSCLNSKYAEILEISAIKVVGTKIVDTFSTLVKPKKEPDPAALAINNITPEMLENAPEILDAFSSFLAFIENNHLLGYNIATFDMPILRRYASELFNIEITNDYSDILYMAKKCLNNLPNYKLCTVAAYFCVDTAGSHRALNDCYITKQCYDKLLHMEPSQVSEKTKSHRHKAHYSSETKALQTLQGFLLGVIADNVLTESEVVSLKKWLDDNASLSGQYPFDRVFWVIEKALEDGILEQSELDEMLLLFKRFSSPVEECACTEKMIDFSGKILCLTGDFEAGSRKTIEQILINLGATCKSSVTKKTDYVVVGSLGSNDWSCGNYGTKIKKALELQSQGIDIIILKESDITNLLA